MADEAAEEAAKYAELCPIEGCPMEGCCPEDGCFPEDGCCPSEGCCHYENGCCPSEGCCQSGDGEGCICDPCLNLCTTCLECITPGCDILAESIWCLGSPIAFPIIFCFSPDPYTNESSGWSISMLRAPCVHPFTCCFVSLCIPCGQWFVRRRALGGDMSRYKLWQGYHDGPQCCARICPNAPITIEAGTYGEQDCPNAFLCLEVTCLGGVCSPCCAFNASRQYMKEDRGLGTDPTEARQEKCADFFSQIANSISQVACCCCCASWILQLCCASQSEDAEELSDATRNFSRALRSIAHTCYRGIWSTRMVAIGCMSAQMVHHEGSETRSLKSAPQSQTMERGGAINEEGMEMAKTMDRNVKGVVLK
uniref:Uncharacterized protein n=1 Tax=Ditylum brightwellii TaxID=49249 RepID=A0A7S4SQV2_9STRA